MSARKQYEYNVKWKKSMRKMGIPDKTVRKYEILNKMKELTKEYVELEKDVHESVTKEWLTNSIKGCWI